ncbi:beta-mannosidase [Sporocytophaga myxococcoides]|uniref:Beta-mannosidase B n=1 Tax=Sporocytophaga myxococcoides TaxID=153721 RepID=A0A098LJ28_9BACT|nr:glycoside hydrolase family 2 protein [Sporocytophaga myxococcoides]GAL86387.1 beta-mannosidase [Sporocytophaga myxococcoides]
MTKLSYFFFFFLLVLNSTFNARAYAKEPSCNGQKTVLLDQNWEFRQVGKEKWSKASVPGCVHQDLIENGTIQDPFFRLNEFDVQWIENEDWEYRTTFYASKEIINQEIKELYFKGLDTYADVYLNDLLILSADNMFRSWSIGCSNLKEGNNQLRIVFKSPVKIGQEKLDKVGFLIPVQNEQAPKGKQNSVMTRKAAYHYGWDWGPRLVTSGIWQPIYLHAWSKGKIQDVFFQQKNQNSNIANYSAAIEVITTKDGVGRIDVLADGKALNSLKVKLKKGLNTFNLDLAIKNPELWWSVGLGKQKLYNVKTVLQIEGAETDIRESKLGIRTLKVIQNKDALGKSFYVELNGVPVFMKGADYIPGDNLITRVGQDKYNRVINEALDANMNVLRVWGGAVYETDQFYDLCAEKGLIIYQDFMFACSMYPGDDTFAENIRHEAEEQVKRLRNYPNIMLWAGNNEILNGWHEWNYQERFGYNNQQKDTLWKYYTNIFYKVLPETVKKYDPDKLYWACSPQSEEDKLQTPLSGDQHSWAVWFGEQPFSSFEEQPGRFISEYGFQSYPCINTLKKIALPEDMHWESEVLLKRQRSPMEWIGKGMNGNHMIDRYMKKEFKTPKDFESYVYISQLLHGQAIKTAAEAHRRNMPYTMGSLYWQINDCWPTVSWSTVDYFGNWKASHYRARSAYQDLIVSFAQRNDTVKVFVVSDRLKDTNADLRISVYDFSGNLIGTISQKVTVPGNTSKVYMKNKLSELLKGKSNKDVYLKGELSENGNVITENNFFLSPYKTLSLPKPDVIVKLSQTEDNYSVQVQSDKFAKDVYLYFEGIDCNLSDNFFDLDANKIRTLTFKIKGNPSIEELQKKLRVLTVADSY